MGKINITVLTAELTAVRNEGNRDRVNRKTEVLHCLGYADDKSVSIPEFDAFLVRVASERFGVSANRDIVLMAFGLLNGYHYEKITLIKDRRAKYLTDSDHLQTRTRKKESYADASDKRKNTLKNTLSKIENRLIQDLADYIAEQAEDGNITEYVKSHISPIATPIPIYILSKDDPEPIADDYKDDVTAAEMSLDDAVTPEVPHINSESSETIFDSLEESSEQKAPKKGPQPNAPTSPPRTSEPKKHTRHFSIGPFINIGEKSQINLSLVKNPLFLIIVGIVAVLALWRLSPPVSSNTLILIDSHIILGPSQIYELLAVSFPDKNTDSVLRYVSSDPSVVAVGEHNGMLQTPASHEVGGTQTADITIQDDHGNTAITTVEVNFSAGGGNINIQPNNSASGGNNNIQPNNSAGGGNINIQLDDFVPDFAVIQKVRLAGDSKWRDYVEASLGDVIEVQIEYQNTGKTTHSNVMMRSVLPANLVYVPETTLLYNGSLSEGVSPDPDSLTTNGINIGNYEPQANAFVRFSAKVVDVNLATGSNTLVNWVRVTVDNVTLQDYASVIATKE